MPKATRPTERAVVEAAARFLERDGYRTWIDPDGTNYFDLVARRGAEVGLVEAKVGDARTVLQQALARRAWGDWTAVVLAGRTSASRLETRTRTTRAAPVGIWSLRDGDVEVLRPARSWERGSAPDPYAELRDRFRGILDALESGAIPPGVAWEAVPRAVRRASHGRRFREWRLDEISDLEP